MGAVNAQKSEKAHNSISPVIRLYTGKHSKQSGSSLLPLSPCKWSQSDPRDEYPGKRWSGFRTRNRFTITQKNEIRHIHSTSYLWAEGDFSETLLYSNFLGVWTNQEDLCPAHLQHKEKHKHNAVRLLYVSFIGLHSALCTSVCGEFVVWQQ